MISDTFPIQETKEVLQQFSFFVVSLIYFEVINTIIHATLRHSNRQKLLIETEIAHTSEKQRRQTSSVGKITDTSGIKSKAPESNLMV